MGVVTKPGIQATQGTIRNWKQFGNYHRNTNVKLTNYIEIKEI